MLTFPTSLLPPTLLALTGLFWSASSQACYSSPLRQQMTPSELLVYRGRDVTLAKVVHAEQKSPREARYVFEVQRRFAGPHRRTFELEGGTAPDEPSPVNHESTNFDFWGSRGGRSHNDSDCEIHPSFTVGKIYLVFLEQPYTRKSFELIEDSSDQWLQFVEKSFAGRLPPRVRALRERFEGCAHFSGEEAYDVARKKEIATAMKKLQCARLDADRKSAERRYAHVPEVRAAIEALAPHDNYPFKP